MLDEVLGADLGYFFADSPLLQIYESSAANPSAADSLRLLELFSRIVDPGVRSGILRILEELAAAAPSSDPASPLKRRGRS